MDEPDDATLMARLSRGDAAALGPLYARYQGLVRSVVAAYSGGRCRADVPDVVQEVFVTLFKTAARYRESGKLRGWLTGIAVRQARSWRRRRAWRDALLMRFGGAALEPGDDLEQHLQRLAARREVALAIEKLAVAHREVLVLHVVEELSGDEIAQALGIKVNAVWTRLHRARRALAAVLEEDE